MVFIVPFVICKQLLVVNSKEVWRRLLAYLGRITFRSYLHFQLVHQHTVSTAVSHEPGILQFMSSALTGLHAPLLRHVVIF